MKKISIIIPVFNTRPDLLLACFESVKNQTSYDFECIVVDDCSTNVQTINFLDEYTKNNSFLKLSRLKENVGLGKARNHGFRNTTNEIILYLDADDYLSDFAVADITKKFSENNNIDFYWFDLTRINEISGKKEIDPFSFNTGVVNIDSFPNAFTIQKMAWLKAYSRKFLLQNGIMFLEKWVHCEDVYYNIVVLSKARNFLVSNSRNYNYRIHPNTLENSPFTPKKAAGLLENVMEAFKFIKNDRNCITAALYKWFNFFFYFEMSYHKHDKNSFDYKIIYERARLFQETLK